MDMTARQEPGDGEMTRRRGWLLHDGLRERLVTVLHDDRRNVVIVASVALSIRALFFVAYTPLLSPDSSSYLDLAHRLGAANLTGYNGIRTPGYPLLLLAVHYSPRGIWLIQSLLGVAITVLIYRLVRRLSGGPIAALIAALWYAASLRALQTEQSVITETVGTVMMLASGSLAVMIVDRGHRVRALPLLLALVLAAFCVTRPDALAISIYFVIALAVTACIADRRHRSFQWRAAARSAVAMLIPVAIVVLGWSGVNKSTTGVFSLTTVVGHNMIDHVAPQVTVEAGRNHGITAAYVAWRPRVEAQGGLWPSADVSYMAERDMERASHLSYARLSVRLLAIGLNVIVHHPVSYLASSVKQWPFFWVPPRPSSQSAGPDQSSVLRAISWAQVGLQALLALVFITLCVIHATLRLRRGTGVLGTGSAILAGAVLTASLPAVFLAYGEPGRYGLPSVPLVLAVTFATCGSLQRPGRATRMSRR